MPNFIFGIIAFQKEKLFSQKHSRKSGKKEDNMFKYVLKRIGLMLVVFFIIISICFVLVKLLPNTEATQFGKDRAIIEQRRAQLGYDKPLIVQYGIFIQKTLLGFNWGVSEELYRGQDVWQIFVSKLPSTMLVNTYTMFIAVPIGLLLGIYAALKKNKWQDHVISTGVMIFISVPSYVYAFLVQYFLCFKWKLFPVVMEAGTDYTSWIMIWSRMENRRPARSSNAMDTVMIPKPPSWISSSPPWRKPIATRSWWASSPPACCIWTCLPIWKPWKPTVRMSSAIMRSIPMPAATGMATASVWSTNNGQTGNHGIDHPVPAVPGK